MRLTVVHAGLCLALLGGCAGDVRTAELGAEHPASPSAAEAPLPPPSQTLAIDTAAAPSGDAPGVIPPQVRGPGGTPATAPAGVRYACPMHPEVTSADPNARCPKCGMKVNKPVKSAATAPAATRPIPGTAAQQPGHGHDHGRVNK